MRKYHFLSLTTVYILAAALTGCGQNGQSTIPDTPIATPSQIEISQESTVTAGSIPSDASDTPRDNTPVCLVPEASGSVETRNNVAVIDASHTDKGYIMANYTGSVSKVKLRIKGPDKVEYTYDLHGNGYETFPLSSGNGAYTATIYENISGTNYTTCLYADLSVEIADEFSPFLYPNQYISFNAESKTVQKAAELAEYASNDLDVITSVYNFIVSSITYDHAKAANPPVGYTTDVDEILDSGTGICLDYAALMTAMLRSQSIPTRLEVGYAQDAYHAWISVYTEETGWMNGLIEFDSSTWTLVDPTFGANSTEKALKKFIGDGSNYVLQKLY